MNRKSITFFMIVTDPDIIIADYCVQSYSKIKNLDFELLIYSNWVNEKNKKKYFNKWKKLDFVNIIENNFQTEEYRPKLRTQQGPFEHGNPIWNRELNKINTELISTVDPDFEILNSNFINYMLKKLESDNNLVAFSTDYSPRIEGYYDSYTNDNINLNERWHNWFCIYKKEAFQISTLYSSRVERKTGSNFCEVWDSFGYFQEQLKNKGYKLRSLNKKYRSSYIHYAAFAKNRHINEFNVPFYRKLRLLHHNGINGNKYRPIQWIINLMYDIFLKKTDDSRQTFLPGWAKGYGSRIT